MFENMMLNDLVNVLINKELLVVDNENCMDMIMVLGLWDIWEVKNFRGMLIIGWVMNVGGGCFKELCVDEFVVYIVILIGDGIIDVLLVL